MEMKKRILSLGLALIMTVGLLAGCGGSDKPASDDAGNDASAPTEVKKASWKVTCPWAPSGVAAMVSQKAASKSTEYSDVITLTLAVVIWACFRFVLNVEF